MPRRKKIAVLEKRFFAISDVVCAEEHGTIFRFKKYDVVLEIIAINTSVAISRNAFLPD